MSASSESAVMTGAKLISELRARYFEALLKGIESSAAIYQRIDKAGRRMPGMILLRALKDEALLERATAETISRAVPLEIAENAVESKGQVALRLGLLLGLLHAAGGHLLAGIEQIISKVATDVTAKVLVDTLKADGSFVAAIAFFSIRLTP